MKEYFSCVTYSKAAKQRGSASLGDLFKIKDRKVRVRTFWETIRKIDIVRWNQSDGSTPVEH